MPIVYGSFLRHCPDVRRKPDFYKMLAPDIRLELFLGDSYAGKDTWVTAVVSVRRDDTLYKMKYDSGKIKKGGLKKMAKECTRFIMKGWGLDYFRRNVDDLINKNQNKHAF